MVHKILKCTKKNLWEKSKTKIENSEIWKFGKSGNEFGNRKFGNEFGLNVFCKMFGKSDLIAQAWL